MQKVVPKESELGFLLHWEKGDVSPYKNFRFSSDVRRIQIEWDAIYIMQALGSTIIFSQLLEFEK